mmetsp:Transcript_47474/g.120256  ORF Transcript_47474/g.120256 Transcript_47474/m.120256 type:complete len:252 (+) Transcript_47474:751-1506(+)
MRDVATMTGSPPGNLKLRSAAKRSASGTSSCTTSVAKPLSRQRVATSSAVLAVLQKTSALLPPAKSLLALSRAIPSFSGFEMLWMVWKCCTTEREALRPVVPACKYTASLLTCALPKLYALSGQVAETSSNCLLAGALSNSIAKSCTCGSSQSASASSAAMTATRFKKEGEAAAHCAICSGVPTATVASRFRPVSSGSRPSTLSRAPLARAKGSKASETCSASSVVGTTMRQQGPSPRPGRRTALTITGKP